MYNAALIGLGEISKYYLNAIELNPDFSLYAVCDISSSKLLNYASNESVLATSDFEVILKENQVDCIFIALPNYLHYKICIKSLNAGKHVCCEKPLALKLDDARNILSTAIKNNVTIFTAFHRRYNKFVKQYKRRRNVKIRRVTVKYHDKVNMHDTERNWYFDRSLSGGGCLMDSGTNAIDLLQTMVGTLNIEGACIHEEICHKIESKITVTGIITDNIQFMIDLDWSSHEKKEIIIEYNNNIVDIVDLLKESIDFKDSMFHEYVGVLNHFSRAIEFKKNFSCIEIVELVEKSYQLAGEYSVSK